MNTTLTRSRHRIDRFHLVQGVIDRLPQRGSRAAYAKQAIRNALHGKPPTSAARQQIDEQVRRAAYHIIAGKGATYYGIGSAVARIVDELLHDQWAILTICCRIAGVPGCDGVTLALPHLVGGEGALATIPLPLDITEQEGLRRSAGIRREAIASIQVSAK